MDKVTKLRIKKSLIKGFKGGVGSGNFGHAGRPGLVGGSMPKGETHRKLSKSDRIDADARKLLSAIKKNPYGFTYEPDKGSPKHGFMVAIEGHEWIIDASKLTANEVIEYVRKSYDIIKSNKRLYYGGWYNSETGKYIIDLSERYDSLRVAWDLGKIRKASDGLEQVSIFNLDTLEEIPVRGLTKPPKTDKFDWEKIYNESPEEED